MCAPLEGHGWILLSHLMLPFGILHCEADPSLQKLPPGHHLKMRNVSSRFRPCFYAFKHVLSDSHSVQLLRLAMLGLVSMSQRQVTAPHAKNSAWHPPKCRGFACSVQSSDKTALRRWPLPEGMVWSLCCLWRLKSLPVLVEESLPPPVVCIMSTLGVSPVK